MEFTVNKVEFLQAVQEVQRVTYGKVGLTTLQGILIKAKKDNLVLTGGDKNLCLETQIRADVPEEGGIVVESRLLGDIIKKLPDALIEISTISDKHIKIVCEKNIITLSYQEEDSFPTLPAIKEDIKVSIPQNIIKKMIRGTTFATEQSGLRPVYSGVLFDLRNDKLNMVALDNSRAAICFYLADSRNTISVVIPGRTLNEVAKIYEWEDTDVKITFTSNHILFTIGKTKIISTLLDGDFGRYETFIPHEYTLKVVVRRQSLIDHLERASVIGREGNVSAVVFDIQENSMLITSISQVGEIRGELDIVSEGEPMIIKVNSKYLLEALNVLEDDEVVISFTTNLSVFVLTNRNNVNSKHIIAPIRMN